MSQKGTVQSVRANASLKPPIINPIFLKQLQASNLNSSPIGNGGLQGSHCERVEASPLKKMNKALIGTRYVSTEKPGSEHEHIKERGAQKCHASLKNVTSPKNPNISPSMVATFSNMTGFKRRRDGKYLERRLKNNLAAKKSRDQRKIRELSLNDRAGSLSQENALLKAELSQLRRELTALRVAQFQKEVLQEQQRTSEGLFWQTATLNFLIKQLKRSHQPHTNREDSDHPYPLISSDLCPHFARESHDESQEDEADATGVQDEIDVEEHEIKSEVQTDQGD
ncbi:hypothetical protein TCAL_04569 [Tigriopus californicus]|uniref:BZIP domain-containing protein n=1 Tax=Tigriopus californicus TaxID=6832 RepID=A0A553NVB4_TIGCA|nr:protein giant-like [Tigriopus californicus]TRY69365.1 hypothetical protein TCAL_04569 [Tigriopus californicus]|eukprot:TCALIF_04569-PA protein Name:"Similar to nfil3 Nuclear factor interleukin-3-regulated protein (Xenopus tropicalis)" AED:0.01 eAED:0.01 QI:140/1/0.5/1/1/1/2/0/281